MRRFDGGHKAHALLQAETLPAARRNRLQLRLPGVKLNPLARESAGPPRSAPRLPGGANQASPTRPGVSSRKPPIC
jgi:hypothetical protein